MERPLDAEDLVIADDSGPLALAGTMGGASSEITASTSNLVIEAAHFDAVVGRPESRRHKLSSEASRRFERASTLRWARSPRRWRWTCSDATAGAVPRGSPRSTSVSRWPR